MSRVERIQYREAEDYYARLAKTQTARLELLVAEEEAVVHWGDSDRSLFNAIYAHEQELWTAANLYFDLVSAAHRENKKDGSASEPKVEHRMLFTLYSAATEDTFAIALGEDFDRLMGTFRPRLM